MCDHHGDNDQGNVFGEEKGLEDMLGFHEVVRHRAALAGTRLFANDNISHLLQEGDLEKIQEEVEWEVLRLLRALCIDTANDHNTKNTAHRVAKMMVHEIYGGRFAPMPKITTFPNDKQLDELYTTGPISVRSACSHHMVPIIGKCWIGVIPKETLFGLSKFNRIVDWVSRRPQIQEEMTVQIADIIEQELHPVGLAVVVEASHMCMTLRGVKENPEATMSTSVMRGKMLTVPSARAEFFELIGHKTR